MTESRTPKRVLIFSFGYPPFVGGVEVALTEITKRVPPEEIEFHVLTLRIDSNLPREERMGNVTVHRMGFARPGASIVEIGRFPFRLNLYLYEFCAGIKALSLHRRYRFDGIWAMMAHTAGLPASIFKLFHPRVPYLLTLQEGDPTEYIERLMRPVWPLFKRAFTKADMLQAISTFLLAWGKRMGFAGHAEVIPNGVDTMRFARLYSDAEVEAMRARIGKKEEEVYLVTTSRLVHKNGIDDVIRALPNLPENVSFLIYGIGAQEPELRELAASLKVENRTRFMGEIGHQDMPLMLAACDIFIRPSRSEGMGNSFIEAMAAGLPVIATQEGGISDFLFDARRNPERAPTGFAVEKDSPVQIVEAVKHIIAHPEEAAQAAKNGQELALRDYGWDGIAVRMRAVFKRLVG